MHALNPVYTALPTTIFEHMSGLARASGAINLGQGFPDAPPPPALCAAVVRALAERSQHYPPMAGVPELRDAIATFYRRSQGLALVRDQVIVTSGATEAIAAAVLAVVSPGDEVLLFQPAYDAYAPLVRRVGAVPVFVPLHPPHWHYDRTAIEAAITPRTRAMMINDPLNPTGTVMDAPTRAMLAQIAVSHDLFAICDEVWETVRFDGGVHGSLLAEAGMAARAVKIGSAGKIFGATGWKVGWMIAAPEVAAVLAKAHQFLTFTTPPMLQWAVAEGLADDALIAGQVADWAASRAVLNQGLQARGFAVLPGVATWFSCIDLAASGLALDDRTVAERLVHKAGVASIPLSALWEGDDAPRHILRLCHCKPAAMVEDAIDRIARWRDALIQA
ncbi:aminotransferase class I/II-fold pyridoxal phosphate-dependent enzyme [Novosphingobium sp. FSW06-99]|uniref:aminotransferase class I/II-fold pyridoxal phosphate-dependent enzyme n=1 Tax=Novosphingobium sp. FSW06-99 TaxID=1739113 RepID=UPI00076C0AC3|nr:aminotransferase class I/II-fold pyridoxal phosphate-dependent enzyme [Novosphingobium sp. FSW06-99]KUR74957.1 aminotransferase [Novosphingobium sp. FSW06-99]